MRYARQILLIALTVAIAVAIPLHSAAQQRTNKAISRPLQAQAGGAPQQQTTAAISSSTPLSSRIVAYKIDAKYDPKTHTVDAQQTLTYRNDTGVPLDRFPFHLYLNAFQPGSTFMNEVRWGGGTRDNQGKWEEKFGAYNNVTKLEVDGMGDLTGSMRFTAPDDGNPNDKTVMEVQLPRPVPPGASITFRMNFKAKFGEPVMRAGYKRDYLLAGQWFPKVGVWWKSSGSSAKPDPNETKPGWNCHQYHNSTEYFADYGTFDVNLTLPDNLTVGSTGIQTSEKKNGDGTKTLTFRAEDVHDFAWTAAERYQVVEDSVQLSTGKVKIRALISPGHMSSAQRYISNVKGTMEKFDAWYGPYPYPQITLVDPPSGGMATGGMEYPMLITLGTSWLMPRGVLGPELVTEHEFGHQYWYGMVGSNEFEDAWLDEGINSYTEVKIMDALYGRDTSAIGTRVGIVANRELQRVSYMGRPDVDPLARNAWQFSSYNAYGGMTYGKTATMLLTLESIIGEETLRKALNTYFMRYRYKHPTEQDFLNTVNEVAGQDLTWYWQQAVYGTETFDYRVQSATSDRMDWAVKDRPKEKKGETDYHSQVVVHRKGSFVFPIILEVKFDNGETVREHWDGRDRWKRFEWQKKAKIVSAELDPDHTALLDTNVFNNSHVQTRQRGAAKITAYWVLISQWFGQILTWLA